MSYRELSAKDLYAAIRNIDNVYDYEVEKIFYYIKDKMSENKEDMEKVLYLLKNYRPNLVAEVFRKK